jgi:K+-sensing histidine kinase KdpD
VAVVVETPDAAGQPFDRARDLQEALDDAVDLGADVFRVEARDLVSGLEAAAHARHASHLVLPHREGPGGIGRLRERPLVDRLLERLPDVEVHVVGPGPSRRV